VPEQSCMPHENAYRRLFTESCAPLRMLTGDSIYTGDSTLESIWRRSPKWLPRRTSASMPMRKKRCPQQHRRSDGHSAMAMTMTTVTTTPPHRRRNPPGEPALTTVAPPTRRTTMTMMTTKGPMMMTMTGVTTI
jgi:hypothetical protein